jgi:hypothetical protein
LSADSDPTSSGTVLDEGLPPVLETLPGPPPAAHFDATESATKPAVRWQCLHCGDTDDYVGAKPPGEDVVRCDRCLGVTAYGRRLPRCTIEPDADPRFVIMRLDTLEVPLLREYARAIALDLLSVCPETPTSQ